MWIWTQRWFLHEIYQYCGVYKNNWKRASNRRFLDVRWKYYWIIGYPCLSDRASWWKKRIEIKDVKKRIGKWKNELPEQSNCWVQNFLLMKNEHIKNKRYFELPIMFITQNSQFQFISEDLIIVKMLRSQRLFLLPKIKKGKSPYENLSSWNQETFCMTIEIEAGYEQQVEAMVARNTATQDCCIKKKWY